jgi:hypothetical protein
MDSQKKAIKIRSSIRPELKKTLLFRGTILGGVGALLVLFGGILPFEALKQWGTILFITGILFIGIGFYPFRKISKLEAIPDELHFDGETLIYFQKGKPLLEIPYPCIKDMVYCEDSGLYGVIIHLKKPLTQKMRILQKSFNPDFFLNKLKIKLDGDLFFPYFTERSLNELLENGEE